MPYITYDASASGSGSDEDDQDEDEDEDSSRSDSIPDATDPFPELPRPNRFSGKPSTWRDYTAADRDVAAALQQSGAGDLAAHLYNAHALKRRVWVAGEELAGLKAWQGREVWGRKGAALEFTDLLGRRQVQLVPGKRWTA